jgi:hypothetical protein
MHGYVFECVLNFVREGHMATITSLRPEADLWKITKIPRYKTEEHLAALRTSLKQRFRIKADRTVIVISKRGELLEGFADAEDIIDLYRSEGAISMIIFTFEKVVTLTRIHIDA